MRKSVHPRYRPPPTDTDPALSVRSPRQASLVLLWVAAIVLVIVLAGLIFAPQDPDLPPSGSAVHEAVHA